MGYYIFWGICTVRWQYVDIFLGKKFLEKKIFFNISTFCERGYRGIAEVWICLECCVLYIYGIYMYLRIKPFILILLHHYICSLEEYLVFVQKLLTGHIEGASRSRPLSSIIINHHSSWLFSSWMGTLTYSWQLTIHIWIITTWPKSKWVQTPVSSSYLRLFSSINDENKRHSFAFDSSFLYF